MTYSGALPTAPRCKIVLAALLLIGGAACAPETAPGTPEGGPYAPGVDLSREAEPGLEVGNRLMAAGEYELALRAFTRAALEQGMTEDIQISIGTANIGLGRLGQAEMQLRRAIRDYPRSPEAWNNLGVVLMETDQTPEARQVFRTAYALDNGESDAIRDNLRLALAKSEISDTAIENEQDYKLVQRGQGEYLIRETP